MTEVKRPRVAAIGLDDAQIEAIRPMCGDLRTAGSLDAYTHSWTETDILVAADLHSSEVVRGVHLLTLGSMQYGGSTQVRGGEWYFTGIAQTHSNKERELSISRTCPLIYSTLAGRLSNELASAQSAPPIVHVTEYFEPYRETLVETSSAYPVALRLQIVNSNWTGKTPALGVEPIALFLPRVTNLAEWFRAFLTDINEIDPFRVPQPPPRLLKPADWYTPEEVALAERIAEIDAEFESLENERSQVEARLVIEREKADAGIRRAIWGNGDHLVEAVSEILRDLGFHVRNMDAELDPKREDLRLTIVGQPDWEAIVEVKGYPKGTKTNDARQIREHREHYMSETGRLPDLTVWLANPFRQMDPSSRPLPSAHTEEAAANIGAIHVLSTDLYKQWALVMRGKLAAHDAVKSLTNAEPGLWRPPTSSEMVE